MRGAFYCKAVSDFLTDADGIIRDALTQGTSEKFYQQLSTQTDSWLNFIKIFKSSLSHVSDVVDWGVLLEYPIPRRSKRIDAVLIAESIVFVIEYKDNEAEYKKGYVAQLEDYCLDLRDFHLDSKDKVIVPILLCPNAPETVNNYQPLSDDVQEVLFANRSNLNAVIASAFETFRYRSARIDYNSWNRSKYSPTPTIIEAAQALYAVKT